MQIAWLARNSTINRCQTHTHTICTWKIEWKKSDHYELRTLWEKFAISKKEKDIAMDSIETLSSLFNGEIQLIAISCNGQREH